MDLFSLENLAALSEQEAYRAKAERRNLAYLRPLSWFLVFASIIELGTALESGSSLGAIVAGFQGLSLLLFLLLLRRLPDAGPRGKRMRFLDRLFSWLEPLAEKVARHRSAVVIGFLASQYLLLVSFVALLSGEQVWPFVFPVMIVFYRFPVGEAFSLHGAFLLIGIVESLYRVGTADIVGLAAGSFSINAVVLTVGLLLTRRYRRSFLLEWRRAVGRHKDQIRMRKELEVARDLQLSMLPQESPELDWLEVVSLSQPAKEVGGDYYDYFPLADGSLVVAGGDVAGHGLPSGLVLAGLRSCLTMLAEDLHDPVTVLKKLDRMVRLTSRQRTLVTLSLVLLDPSEGTVSVTSAGHPPVMVSRADGGLEEIGRAALPLGVGLAREFEPHRSRIEKGDSMVLYSDGIYEALDESGEVFGLDRLEAAIREGSERGSAADIRDSILASLEEHQGSVAQSDDITLVVLRVRRDLASTSRNSLHGHLSDQGFR